MDTDNLTKMAHKTIDMAHKVSDFLPCELGVWCDQCKDEDEFLKKALSYVQRIENDPVGYLESWKALDSHNLQAMLSHIITLKIHLQKVIKVPMVRRGHIKW